MSNTSHPLRPFSAALLALAGGVVMAQETVPPPRGVLADDLSLSDLLDLTVDEAGFFPLDPGLTPTTSYLIDQQRLERLPVMTLGDLVADVIPGMSLGRHGRTGVTIGTRGLLIDNNAKTLVLWNGQNLNQRTHFGYHAGLMLPLLGDLGGVEVVHGPSSTVHGSGAINGIIGLQAQHGAVRPGAWTRVSGGPIDDLVTAETSVGGSPGADHEWFVYAGGAMAGGVDTGDQTPSSSSGDHARELQPSARISGNTRWNTAIGEWRFQALAQRAAIDSAEVQLNPIDEYWRHELFAARLGWSLPFAARSSVEVQVPVELHAFQATNRAGDERGGAEHHGELNLVVRTELTDRVRMAFGGLTGMRGFSCGDGLFDEGPGSSFQTMDGKWRETAAFGELQGSLGPLQLIAGIRWDRFTADRFTAHDDPTVPNDPSYQPPTMAAWSPRLAASFQPTDEVVVRASWQRGFRTPDVAYWVLLAWYNEGLAADGLPLRPDVEPESMDSFELGMSLTAPDRRAALALNGFWNQYHDTLYFRAYSDADVAAGVIDSAVFENMALTRGNRMPGHFINAGEDFAAIGAELVLSGQPATWCGLEASYGYSRPLNLDGDEAAVLRLTSPGGDTWSRYPTHLVKADGTVLLGSRCDLTLGLRWQSAVEINPPTPLTAESFDHQRTILNTRIRWFGRDGWQVALTAQNLLGDDTPPVGDSNQYWNGKTGDDVTLLYLHLGWEW
jgi:outer membrane receptor protein involved in Fe transport